MPKMAAVIPAYNEQASITQVVAEVNALRDSHGLDITAVVVNDASTDQTAQTA